MAGAGSRQLVGVSCSCTWEREALVSWVARFGYPVAVVERGAALADRPAVIVVNGRDTAAQAGLDSLPPAVHVIVIGGRRDAAAKPAGRLHLPDGPDVADRLRTALESLLGPAAGRVELSRREREILATYVLGATVEATAAEHFVAISTVRTHYRRVTARYTEAGRPVSNKSQLLLRMVADGWVALSDAVPSLAQSAVHAARGGAVEPRKGAA